MRLVFPWKSIDSIGWFTNRFNKSIAPLNEEGEEAIKSGIQSCLSRGPLLGFAMTNMKIALDPTQCSWDAQTPAVVLQSAIIAGLNDALRSHKLILLEPVMSYETLVSTNVLGNVISDLTASMDCNKVNYQ